MISILFCVIMIYFLRFFNEKMIVCNIIFFFAFLIYFVILKSFLKQFFKICIIARKSFFLCYIIILLFRSQIFMYVYYSLKMQHSCLKHYVFLIILMHFWNHSNFICSWNLIHDINCFVDFLKICKNVVI